MLLRVQLIYPQNKTSWVSPLIMRGETHTLLFPSIVLNMITTKSLFLSLKKTLFLSPWLVSSSHNFISTVTNLTLLLKELLIYFQNKTLFESHHSLFFISGVYVMKFIMNAFITNAFSIIRNIIYSFKISLFFLHKETFPESMIRYPFL